MNLPTYMSEPQVQNLHQILEDIRQGGLLIPRFQRLFQWTDEQRLTLLQSVREGLPIGSILVWRTTEHKLDTFTNIAGAKVPTAKTEGPPWQYLLDGHQRLTTLFGALRSRRLDLFSPILETGEVERSWDIYFDLKEEKFLFRGKQQDPPQHWIPTHILLDSVALLKFQRDLNKNGSNDALVDGTDRLALTMRNYKLPVIPIVTNDLRNVTVAFQRVNSGGTRMSDADMVVALTFDSSHDLRRDFDEASDKLSEVGWGAFDTRYLLAVVRISKDLEIASPDAGETSKVISAEPELIHEATSSVLRAAKFLKKHCSIGGPNVVPYSYQSVLLAEALRIVPEPSDEIARELCRWFWATSYTGYFLGARDREVAMALDEVRRIARGDEPVYANKRLNIEPLPRRYDFRAARCKALATRLAELNPKDIEANPAPFDAVSTIAGGGPESLSQLVPRRFATGQNYSGPENRFVVPPEQASRIPFFISMSDLLGLDPSWCDSHAVSKEAVLAWEARKFEEFLRIRRQTLIELENRFLASYQLQPQQDPTKMVS